jgi:hypothetical protein
MSCRLRPAALCLVAAWAITPAPLRAEDVKDLKSQANIVMDHGPLAYKPQAELVIRSAEQLVVNSTTPRKSRDRVVQQEMTAALARLFKVDAIDWDKQMVVAIMTGGGRGDAGNLAFVSFLRRGKSLTVHYRGPAFPDHNCASNSGLALIPRCDGKVCFDCGSAPKANGRKTSGR